MYFVHYFFSILFVSKLVFAYSDDVIVKLLQEYIQIPSVTHSDFGAAVEFWIKLAIEENLSVNIFEFVQNYPVIVIKWPGLNSTLPSVLLNSHMDVVPANEQDGWLYPPFSGHIDENNDIYGRGTQDMKSVSLQHFEALRRLRYQNVVLLRDVYMSIMPDEEVGGAFGMVQFAKSQEFAAMNVGVALDEGWGQNVSNVLTVFAKDKAVWQFQVDCYGVSVHGSIMPDIDTTAFGKCLHIINDILKFRDEQYEISKAIKDAGAYTSVNLNILHGGNSINTVPGHVKLVFDARLGCDVREDVFLNQLNRWTFNYGDDVTLTFLVNNTQTPRTRTDDASPYWIALTRAAGKLNISLDPIVTTGATDGRYLRALGVPVFGISPMLNTPMLAHSVNERLNIGVFLKGVDIISELIQSIANLADENVDLLSLLTDTC